MKKWLGNGADIPQSAKTKEINIHGELTSMEYFYNNKMQLQLLSKKDLKKKGNDSPDVSDALAYTFAANVYDATPARRMKKRVRRMNTVWA
jgi:hypothetical protein